MKFSRVVAAIAALASVASVGFPAQTTSPEYVQPTGADWEAYNKSPDGQRFSPLEQINTGNVASLREVCRVRLSPRGALGSGPVVVGDSLFITTATDTFAIDPVTCALQWRHTHQRAQEPILSGNRGIAWMNGRVYRGTDDARLLALDASTGKQIWSNIVGNAAESEYIMAAPLAWNGLVIVGISGSEFGIRGRIMAFDAMTGREVWRFHTIPMGSETGADTWGDRKWSEHGGGGTWSTITVDPRTAELFIPVGNPVPDFAPMDRKGANLFTNSVLVLDAGTGALKWWYQLQANDDRDHDLAAAPVLFRNAQHEPMVAAAGKDGLLHVIDRATHQARFKVPVTTVDEVRRPVTQEGTRVCPGASAGVMYNGPAFDPGQMLLFTGAIDQCMVIRNTPGTRYGDATANFGGSFSAAGEPTTGWVTAVDPATGTVRWRYHAEAGIVAGVTATAGGLVMTGDNAGNFMVFESKSGRLLRKDNTGGAIAGGVVTYFRGGRQYVAFTSGNISPVGTGSVGRPSIVVMALPDSMTTSRTGVASSADADRGKALYGLLCGGCHGPDGARLADKPLKAAAGRMDAGQLARAILAPAGQMPRIFPEQRSSDDERDIDAIVSYLKSGLH